MNRLFPLPVCFHPSAHKIFCRGSHSGALLDYLAPLEESGESVSTFGWLIWNYGNAPAVLWTTGKGLLCSVT